MKIWTIRFCFIIASAAICYVVYDGDVFAVLAALVVALLLVAAEFCLHLSSTRDVVASLIGLFLGLLVAAGGPLSFSTIAPEPDHRPCA